MTTSKHLLILANSIKHRPNVCVAGREIRSVGNSFEIGPWIRPVSANGEGELAPSETSLEYNQQPKVLDFIEIPLERKIGDPVQPENWLIWTPGRWRSVNSSYEKPRLDLLSEEPESIWLQQGERTDRVSADHLMICPPKQSLYMIHVPSIVAIFEWKEWEGKYKRQYRALLNYRGVDYKLSITDEDFSKRHRDKFPKIGQPSNTFRVTPANGCYVCVSLTHKFNGFHYKVVATVIEAGK